MESKTEEILNQIFKLDQEICERESERKRLWLELERMKAEKDLGL